MSVSPPADLEALRISSFFNEPTASLVSGIANDLEFVRRTNISRALEFHEILAASHFVTVPKILSTRLTSELLANYDFSAMTGRFIQAAKGGDWTVHMIDETLSSFHVDTGSEPLSQLQLCYSMISLICKIAGVLPSDIMTTKRWINRYRSGEYITPHKDTTGDFQSVLCLAAPPSECGGYIETENGHQILLQPGDMLISHASEVRHWTTPLRPTSLNPQPVRVTAVCRFYVFGGKDPLSAVAFYD